MKFSMLDLLTGRRHQLGALVLMRGETFIETIDDGGMAVLVVLRGTASVSRQRAGAQVGLHLTPRRGEPVWLTSPGTYCVVAKDHVVGLRMLRTGDGL
ncbi:hypothetical protein SAMN02745121_08645 [Nannocystis exedens]|uniref:Cyclic nucleotide-binding domain-containing protein n=1 Tax=Nannocystis exedens TaxID=54 RepID=A0A1I2IIS4_9BACT|nr:hypothetical protein [Nannocystis exedens]PCC68240.1 hypothetical protein NAEX_01250 [Nannocystis exedens]SFF40441.1 hypothetical protein SAMN02745121_08645 [Nannocystis exedens]